MAARRSNKTNSASEPRIELPPGAPAWVSVEMVEQTLRVWQPRYETPLTTEDAVEILMGASGLMHALSLESPPKTGQSSG
jgi:hypothetical protein